MYAASEIWHGHLDPYDVDFTYLKPEDIDIFFETSSSFMEFYIGLNNLNTILAELYAN